MKVANRSLRIRHSAHAACQWAIMVCIVAAAGCQPIKINQLNDRIQPSNYRDWSPEFAQLPYAEISETGEIHLFRIRNNLYLSETDFVPQYYDRTFHLTDVQTVDFCLVPFKGHEYMAHTMLSFGLQDGSFFAISSEIRTEKGETYSPFLGLTNQYELTYVIADERDLIRLRTHHRDADVYLYPTQTTPEQTQALLLDMLQRINQLAQQPEFYDTIRNNCTTNIVGHVNHLKKNRIAYTWQLLMPGFSDRYAYDLGMLDNSIPFEQLKQLAWVNDLAEKFYDAPDFSQKIRRRRLLTDTPVATTRNQQGLTH